MFRPLFGEVGHLDLDDPRIDTIAARGQSAGGDVLDHAPIEKRQLFATCGAHDRDRFANDANRMNEAELARFDIRRSSGLMHQLAHGVIRDQQAVKLLHHADRCFAA